MSDRSIPPEVRLRHLEGHYADRVAAFRQRLALIGPDQVLIVLLDIGKNVHWASASLGTGQELVKPHRLPTTQGGFSQFRQMLDQLIARHQPLLVLLGHEPTGVYHEPWARALLERYTAQLNGQATPAMTYTFFNPYQVKLARQQAHLRHRKTDPRDLAAMLDLMLRGLGQPAYLPTETELLVRQEVGFIRTQARFLGQLERQIRQQLDRLWPGATANIKRFRRAHPGLPLPTPIVQTQPLQRQRLRVLLQHCPNPHDLVHMSDEDLLALYRQHTGRCGPSIIRTLRTWTDNAVLLPENIAAPLAEQLRLLFQQYLNTETLIEEGHGRLQPLVPLTSARHLVAIPGLGEYDAARYLAAIGSPDRFQRAAEIWAFIGFDPLTDGSGDYPDRVGRLSKRGEPAARDTFYLMGYRVSMHYAPIGLVFLNAFDRGQCEVEATIHATHKLNRICFHLIKHDEPFENRSTPELEAEAHRRWQQFKVDKRRRGHRRKRGKRRR